MRRVVGLVTLAMLSASCALRPWTPSVSVAFWSEDVPPSRDVTLPKSDELARLWRPPVENPWARFYKGTLVTAVDAMGGRAPLPEVRSLEVIAQAESAADNLAQVGMPADTLWLVDLRGAASCAFAARLSRASSAPVVPILTFNNWPANDAVVPADETIAGLLAFTPRLPAADATAAHPVFLLDSWRLAYRFDQPDDETFDNRYMLMPSDLPDAKTLQELGITRVVYLVEDLDDAEVEEDDLHASLREWQTAGIGVHMIDLPFLSSMPAPPRGAVIDWALALAPQSHWVRERYTLVDDPHFYARARGGFGLSHGRPTFSPGGFRGSGGGFRGGG